MDGKKSSSSHGENGKKTRWTNKEKQTLINRRKQNVPYWRISNELGRTENSCKQKHSELNGNGHKNRKNGNGKNGHKNGNGNGYRKWTEEDVNDLIRYKKQDVLNNTEIADMLGRNEKSVSNKLARLKKQRDEDMKEVS